MIVLVYLPCTDEGMKIGERWWRRGKKSLIKSMLHCSSSSYSDSNRLELKGLWKWLVNAAATTTTSKHWEAWWLKLIHWVSCCVREYQITKSNCGVIHTTWTVFWGEDWIHCTHVASYFIFYSWSCVFSDTMWWSICYHFSPFSFFHLFKNS